MIIVTDRPSAVEVLEVTAGVDTHADFHVAAVIDPLGPEAYPWGPVRRLRVGKG